MQQFTMRKTLVISLFSTLALIGLLTNCKKTSTPPVSELIAKVWTVSKVEANGTTVYTRGGTSNVQDYSNFRLDLSTGNTVKYTEFDKSVFNGQYTLPSDTQLTLINLNPAPTGTGSNGSGTISYVINSIDESNLKITRTTASVKTGGTTNVYTLTSP